MNRKYLAFDIETAKILPADAGDLMSHRPLGICCVATLASDEDRPQLFYSTNKDETPAAQMTRDDLSNFVDFLMNLTNDGYTIVTWNGSGFDFNILAEESDRFDACKQFVLGHVDMMFHVFCLKGFAVSLNAAAKGVGLQGKLAGVDGSIAPQLWKDGEFQRVLDYVAQDCKTTLDLAITMEQQKTFRWVTRRGTISQFDLQTGWLSVQEANDLPLPDTSWMDKPWPRSKFIEWLG